MKATILSFFRSLIRSHLLPFHHPIFPSFNPFAFSPSSCSPYSNVSTSLSVDDSCYKCRLKQYFRSFFMFASCVSLSFSQSLVFTHRFSFMVASCFLTRSSYPLNPLLTIVSLHNHHPWMMVGMVWWCDDD